MWSISVLPMPSIMRTPVAAFHASHTGDGSISPAETHVRSDRTSRCETRAAIARYATGAVKTTLARNRWTASSSVSALAFSSNTVAAPTSSGNKSSPPRPNVKASGGLPQKTSSADARSTFLPNVSHVAAMSRWKCIAAFGLPVVPDVNAIIATSSACVS